MGTRTRPLALDGHSLEADLSLSAEGKGSVRVVVLGLFATYPRMTLDDIVENYTRRARHYPAIKTVSPQRIRTAVAELTRAGHLARMPQPGTSAMGNRATVWALAERTAS